MSNHDLPNAARFKDALEANAARFGLALTAETTLRLLEFYNHAVAWNARLHLFAPCAPEEFATRHVLESLCALPFLPDGARVTDVGSGAGLPVIPCLIARPDLAATLIESSSKKAVYLRATLRRIERHDIATVAAQRFQDAPAPASDIITCRALDRFVEMLPALLAWSPPAAALLLFGGHTLRAEIEAARVYTSVLLPDSEQRFLFVINKA